MTKAKHVCPECGGPLPPRAAGRGRKADFCSAGCRKAFNNRRATRGAVLYDLFMAARFDRKEHAGNITTMAQVARMFREEDTALRAGRKSWSGDQYDRDILTEVMGRSDKALKLSREGINVPSVG